MGNTPGHYIAAGASNTTDLIGDYNTGYMLDNPNEISHDDQNQDINMNDQENDSWNKTVENNNNNKKKK